MENSDSGPTLLDESKLHVSSILVEIKNLADFLYFPGLYVTIIHCIIIVML